jgi:hypothetical protein
MTHHDAYLLLIAMGVFFLLNMAIWINIDLKINQLRRVLREMQRENHE